MKQRNNAFDLLCGLCILRMVTLHAICQTQLRAATWWKETMAWTFFFMSFFFFKAVSSSLRRATSIKALQARRFLTCETAFVVSSCLTFRGAS